MQDYFDLWHKRWRTIVSTTVLVLAMSALLTVMSAKSYAATTRLFVSTTSGASGTDLLQGSSFSQNRVKSYADVIKSPRVLNPVIKKLQLKTTPADLQEQVQTDVPADSVLIDVSVTNPSPPMATRIAREIGRQFIVTVGELETVGKAKQSPVKVSILAQPTVPTSPVSPRPARNLGLGLALGLLLGGGIALVRNQRDTRIKGEKDCAQVTSTAVIGTIAYDSQALTHPLLRQVGTHSARAEEFRSLRTNLQFVDAANHPRSIVFTSSLANEGKTTTMANLAITLAASGLTVCAVEADLRRPRLLGYMGLEGGAGLTSLLIGQAEVDDVLQRYADTRVTVLGAGPIPPNPSELLGSQALSSLISQLKERFDYVIIDAPPLLPVTDAAVLSTTVDGVVVVVGANTTRREELAKSLASLEHVKGSVLGLVLNKVRHNKADPDGYYRDAYASGTPSEHHSGGKPPEASRRPASSAAPGLRHAVLHEGKAEAPES